MQKIEEKDFKIIAKNILFYIDKICKENNISYYLNFGSLLGAIRHKGFIPWDDDIDISMTRDNYNKFIQIMKNDENYRIISMETDEDYYFSFARVCNKKTILLLKNMPEIHDLGVFVDIFPMDIAPDEDELQDYYNEYKEITNKIRYTIPKTAKYKLLNIYGFLRNIKNYPKRIKYKPKNFAKYRRELLNHITKYNGTNNDNYIIMCAYGLKCVFPRKWFEETIEVEFEGEYVLAPKDYDALLKKVYGDYMKLPPESARHSQHHFIGYYK